MLRHKVPKMRGPHGRRHTGRHDVVLNADGHPVQYAQILPRRQQAISLGCAAPSLFRGNMSEGIQRRIDRGDAGQRVFCQLNRARSPATQRLRQLFQVFPAK